MSDPIITRKYSLAEIDEMRQIIRKRKTLEIDGFALINTSAEQIELELRTLMMAGIGPDEIKSEMES